MPPRIRFSLAVLALAATALAVAAVPSIAGSATSAKRSQIGAICKDTFKVNRYFKEGCRWDKDRYTVRSGSTITLNNRSDEPHTWSLVKKSQLPRTLRAAGKCFGSGVCSSLAQAHGFPEGEGPPANPVVNVGAAGFDAPGDSIVLDAKQKTTVKISAKKGTKLYLLCIFHPQMQARINVR